MANITLPTRGSTGTTLPVVRARTAPDGSDMQAINLVDADDNVLGLVATPVRTDPTGTTTQPVSATSLGETTDTKVQSDTGGSLIAFVRGLVSWFAEVIEARAQTPTKTRAINVQIGPGDVISNLPVVMDFDHHQIHEGEAFRWSVLVPAAQNTNTKYVKLIVPNNAGVVDAATGVRKSPHFRFEVIADAAADVSLIEGTSSTGPGTQRTPAALERNGTYTPALQIWEDPTTVTEGTVIWRGLLTGSKQTSGGIEGSGNEFVLKNNQTYFFKFTPAANGTKYLIRFLWYEDLGV